MGKSIKYLPFLADSSFRLIGYQQQRILLEQFVTTENKLKLGYV